MHLTKDLAGEARRLKEDEEELLDLKKRLQSTPDSEDLLRDIKDVQDRISVRKTGGYLYGNSYYSIDQIKERIEYKLKAVEDLVNMGASQSEKIHLESHAQLTKEHVERAKAQLKKLITEENIGKLKTEPLLSGIKTILADKLRDKYTWNLRGMVNGDVLTSFEPLIKAQSAKLANQLGLPSEAIKRMVADQLAFQYLGNLQREKEMIIVGTNVILNPEAASGVNAKLAEGAVSRASKVGVEQLAPAVAKSTVLGFFAGAVGGAGADVLLNATPMGCGADKIAHHFLPVAGPECQPNFLTVNDDSIKRMVALSEADRKTVLKQHPELCPFYKDYYLKTVKPNLEYSCSSNGVANAKYVDPFSGKKKKLIFDKTNDGDGYLQFFEEKNHEQPYRLYNLGVSNKGEITQVSLWDQFLNQGYKHLDGKQSVTKLSAKEKGQLASSGADFKAIQVFLPLLKECCSATKVESSCQQLNTFGASNLRKNRQDQKSSR